MKRFVAVLLFASLFGLEAKEPPEGFAFAVVSDFHMDLDKLKNAFADTADQKIDTMIVVGDSCDGQACEYAKLQTFLEKTAKPKTLCFTIGNHEYYASYHKDCGDYDETGFPNGETSAGCKARFNRFRGAQADGPVYYDTRVNGYHFIFLGGEQSRMDDPKLLDDAALSKLQLDWLKERLKEDASSPKPIFVFLHQPFQDTVSGSTTPCDDGSKSIQQASELKDILSKYPQIFFFSGHTHWELDMPTTHYTDPSFRFHMFNTSSLRDTYNTKDEPIPANSSEGLSVFVTGTSVTVRGRDFLGHRFIPGQTYEIKNAK